MRKLKNKLIQLLLAIGIITSVPGINLEETAQTSQTDISILEDDDLIGGKH